MRKERKNMNKNKRLLPAYPLFVKDPYFSIWHTSEELNGKDTSFWTGRTKRTYGIIKANNKSYAFLGNVKEVEKLTQTSLQVTTFRTIYGFTCEEFDLEVLFFSPLPITDYEIWSCPVTYVEYKITPKTQLSDINVYLCLHEEWCYYGKENKDVRGDVFILNEGKEVAWFGLNCQHVFNRTGDRFGADWGYYFVVADSCFYHTIEDFNKITECEYTSELKKTKYITAQNTHGSTSEQISGKILVAFDDIVSINYFGQMLQGYFFSDGRNIMDAVKFSLKEYDRICKVCEEEERYLEKKAKPYGEKYLALLNATYRQVLASHKLVKDRKGRLLLISKECGSGGCVATVDVTYPTMPFFLVLRPELLKATIEPIFEFANMDAWTYEYAPHDAGVYPFCNGQFYGIQNKESGKYGRSISYQGEDFRKVVLPQYYFYPKGSDLYSHEKQMPIEESADMIIICLTYLLVTDDKKYLEDKLPLLQQWCDYLVKKGLIPENQLCTDDFLKLINKNVNLSIKATVAIKSFAKILEIFGKNGGYYSDIAKSRAQELKNMFGNKVMPFAFDDEGETFSMKYNLAPDKFLKLNVFDEETVNRELQNCLSSCGDFGFPLDNNTALTKCDWMLWMATLTDDKKEQKKIISIVHNFIINGTDRVPFADLYDCNTGIAEEFTNRTVIGSTFVLLLKDKLQKKLG